MSGAAARTGSYNKKERRILYNERQCGVKFKGTSLRNRRDNSH